VNYSGSGERKVAGVREYGNGPSGAIKSGEFLDWLRTCPQFIATNICTVLMTTLQY
jgi:hypothetical protein